MHGPSNGIFLDDERFWPVWGRAAALDVPIYMHLATMDERVADIYLRDYAQRNIRRNRRRCLGLHHRDR